VSASDEGNEHDGRSFAPLPMLYSSVGMTIPWLIRTSDDVGKGCAEEDQAGGFITITEEPGYESNDILTSHSWEHIKRSKEYISMREQWSEPILPVLAHFR
jgi:hypothetical protein